MLRGTLRKGAFGQQCAFNEQLRQWRMLALYRSVSPSLTSLPVVVRVLPAGQVYRLRLTKAAEARWRQPKATEVAGYNEGTANFAFVEPEREYGPAPFGRHSACTIC